MLQVPAADKLVAIARGARAHAYAPYSGFAVGAAVLCADGRIFAGCNIENVSLGATVCAERVALFKAISEGARHFRRIAVVAGAATLTPPCGSCRQLLWEFCGDLEIILANLQGEEESLRLKDLLPRPYDASFFM